MKNIIKSIKKGGSLWLIFLPFCLVLFSFEILPIMSMIYNSFTSKKGFGFHNYVQIFTSKYYTVAIRNSLIISLVSSIVGLIIGIIVANSLNNMSDRVKDAILNFINMTSNFAGVPLAFAYIVMLGSNGIITLFLKEAFGFELYNHFTLYGWTGLALVYVYFQVPMAIMLIYPAFYGLKEEWKEAALNLGANTWYYWRRVVIPVLLPSIVGTFSILFANAMGAYATAYALTSGNFSLITIRLSSLIAGDLDLNPQLASAIAIVLGALLLLSIALNELMLKKVRGGRES